MTALDDPAPRSGDRRPARCAPGNHYRLLGTGVCVHADVAGVAAAIDRLLVPFRCPPAVEIAHRYSLTSTGLDRDHVPLLATRSRPAQLHGLLNDLNRVAVEGFEGFAVHAGVVARGGVVVAFPAASAVGKSTLTAACLGAGFRYVSDEALCVAFGSDLVVPYPKPLKLSRCSARLTGLVLAGEAAHGDDDDEMVMPASELGADLAEGPLRLGHVVQLVRRPGPPALHPLDRSGTVSSLLAMSFNHYRNPLSCFRLASRLAAGARAWRLEYDDPRPAAAALTALVDHGGSSGSG